MSAVHQIPTRSAPLVARPVSNAALRALSKLGALTFTAAPPGSGHRIGLDHDPNGILDGDQR